MFPLLPPVNGSPLFDADPLAAKTLNIESLSLPYRLDSIKGEPSGLLTKPSDVLGSALNEDTHLLALTISEDSDLYQWANTSVYHSLLPDLNVKDLTLGRGGVVPEVSTLLLLPLAFLLLSTRRKRSGHMKTQSPPLNAEYLFYFFLDENNCDALVGDLEGRYRLIHKRFGKRRADFWYWKETIRSAGPIVWAWARKISIKPLAALVAWAAAKGILGHDSWLAALVETWRRIRS